MAEEVEMTPITPAEAESVPPKVSPFGAAPAAAAPATAPSAAPSSLKSPPAAPAPAAPAAESAVSPTSSTIKLKPVIRKPMIRKPIVGGAKPATPPSPAAAKKATQSLKSLTGPIPAQATLRKTGIIAEGILTPAQQQAAKSKTSRISLESAIGVAPVKESPAPMKTIRLRRPTDLKTAVSTPAAVEAKQDANAEVSTSSTTVVSTKTATADEAGNGTDTQKKTLKLHRPSAGIKRPTLGVNRAPAAPAAAPASGGDVPDMPVAELSPVASMSPLAPVDSDSGMSAGVPSWVAALSLITSIAALAAIGVLMWYLWQEGVGPVAGPNEMQFIQM